jgi:uncharacterized protein
MSLYAGRLWILLFASLLTGADFNSLQPQGYVNDFAQVINPAHRAELERYCNRVDTLTAAQIAIVTIRSLEGEPIEDVANNLYRKWGIGKKGKDEGVMLLLVTQDRRMRLEVGYGLEAILPDGYSGQLLRHMRPLLSANNYGAALLEATHQIGERIAKEKGVSLDVSIPSRRQVNENPVGRWFPLLIPFGLFLLFALFSRRRSRYGGGYGSVPWFLPMGGWGGGGGSGSYGSSGGGFGGYDSNDSFGGFGGGDSGGGGASSDW